MNIVVKKSALNELIKTLAEERSFHTRRIDQIAGEDKPVMPDAQVATQLSADQAPVSNPDFLPVNTQQLSQAASQMARQVSQDKIQKFYTGLKKLLRKTSEPKQYKGMSETDLMEALRPLVLREVEDPEGEEDEDLSISDANERAAEEILGWYNSLPRSKKTSFTMKPSGEKGWKTSDFELPAAKIPIEDPASIANAIMRQGEVQKILKKEKGADSNSVRQKISQFFSETAGPGSSVSPEELETLDATKIVDTFFRKADGDKAAFIQLIKDKRAELSAAGKKKKAGEIGLIAASYLRKFETPVTPEKEVAEEPDEKEKKQRLATMQKSLSIGLATRDAVAMREENPKKLEKILQELGTGLTLADFDKLSDEDKDKLIKKVVEILDKERGPYYAVGEMDYLRDIFSEESESDYRGESGKIASTDPIATGVETLAETFYNSAIEPVMSFVVEEMLENNTDISEDFSDIMSAYGFDSYSSFIGAVDDKEGFIDLLTDSTKSILTKDPGIFDNVMPEFGKIRKAVETKGDLSEYEGRMRLLGIEDVGRLRAIFQHLKSPVAFMKAIDATVRLASLKGKSQTAETISDPQELQTLVRKHITKAQEFNPSGLFISNKSLLMSAGIKNPTDLAKMDTENLIKILGNDFAKKLKKSLSKAQRPGQTSDLDDEVSSAISDFSLIIQSDFDKMGDVKNPAAKPVLEYIKKLVNDVKVAADNDPVFDSLSPKISRAVDILLKQKKK